MKKIIYAIFLTIFFSFLIFYIKNYFFWWIEKETNNYIEEKYIDPTANLNINKEEKKITNEEINKIIKDKLTTDYKSAKNINFEYIPINFKEECNIYTNNISNFINFKSINDKINSLQIEIYKNILDTRWKMSNKSVKLFWALKMSDREFLSVFIHEFAHYIDIYFLEKKVIKDLSEYFYEISWESSKVIKPWQKQEDFVSWYAMTNKYEDFAETFTYYVLHNKDFYTKSKKSEILQKKYDFFKNNVFIKNEFYNLDIKEEKEIKNYYRDITKINYNLENFLHYLIN